MVTTRKGEGRRTLRAFVVELVLYGLLVTAYFFGVLLFLGQAVLLEAITTGLLRLLRGGRSE
jgi:hypothetical protein